MIASTLVKKLIGEAHDESAVQPDDFSQSLGDANSFGELLDVLEELEQHVSPAGQPLLYDLDRLLRATMPKDFGKQPNNVSRGYSSYRFSRRY